MRTLTRIQAALLVALAVLVPFVAQSTADGRAAGLPSKSVWLADVSTAMAGSLTYLDRRVARAGDGESLAIVLDIDNTSIATEYAWPQPVKRVRTFALHAAAQGVAVYFITGRMQSQVSEVAPVLRKAGYRFARICGRRPGESLAASKQRCRRWVAAKGYTIVANVGNRSTDFVGKNCERAFKLPNYDNQLS